MNSVGKAINNILQNGTTAMAAHPDFAKHDFGDTYITYRTSGITPFDTKDGPSDLDEIDVDVTIFSTDPATVLDLAEKVRNDLDRVPYGSYNGVGLNGVQFQGEDSDYNDITERYECEQRYIFRVSKSITYSPPSGTCDDASVTNSDGSYSASVASGGSLVLGDNTVTDVDGTTRDVPAQNDVTCAWTTLFVVNSDEDVLATAASYPASNRILTPDITLTQVDGSEGAQPSGVDLVCQWTAFNVVNTSGDICVAVNSFPSVNPVLPKVNVTDVDGTQRAEAACVDIVCAWSDIVIKNQDGDVLDTVTSYPVGGEVEVTTSAAATAYPNIISHRIPSYTTGNAGDYPTLFAASYFDILFPSIPIQMVQLGADNFTLAANNRFGNTSRYTSTDGTASDTGTARFSSYGSGVANIVIDHYRGIMWYNLEISASITWDNAQAQIDALNTASLGGFTDWIRATRDMITLSAIPDNNQDSYLSPNLFISDTTTALRRYMTCELAAYSNLGFFVASNGGEASQSRTTTASGQNRVVAARLMTLSELFG